MFRLGASLLVVLACVGTTDLQAYSCAFSPEPFSKQMKKRFESFPAIFVAEVVEIVTEYPPSKEPMPRPLEDLFRPRPVVHTRFAVIERFKGPVGAQVEHSIDMGRLSVSGGEMSFETGERYLIYAMTFSEEENKVDFEMCTSRLLGLNERFDAEELTLLRKLAKKLKK
jgi:hypothetical protein